MKEVYVILIVFFLNACQAVEEPASQPVVIEEGRQKHVQNMMNQLNNDMKIFAGKTTDFTFEIDGVEVNQENFLKQDITKLVHIAHYTMERVDYTGDEASTKFEIKFSAYSHDHFTEYSFTPEHLKLSFDVEGLLNLSVNHAVEGELSAYGYDKVSGNKMVEYDDARFDDRFSKAQKINYRNAEELSLILMINDSIHIHDFKLPEILLHEH